MANKNTISVNGTTYNLKDNISGYIPRTNYATLTINASDVDTTTLSCSKTLTGATSNSHPIIRPLVTSINNRDTILGAYSALLYAETSTNSITFYFSKVPFANFTISVTDY